MHVLYLIVPPDLGMCLARCFQCIISIREGDPPPREQVREQRLVGEFVVHDRAIGSHTLLNEIVKRFRGIDDLEAAVGNA